MANKILIFNISLILIVTSSLTIGVSGLGEDAPDVLEPEWFSQWEGFGYSEGSDILMDEGYIYMIGWTGIEWGIDAIAILLKFDTNGNMLWNQTWGINSMNMATSLYIDEDAIYIVGSTGSGLVENFDGYILKYDKNGNMSWNKTWGGDELDIFSSVWIYNDALYIAGSTESYGNGSRDVLLLKYDKNGTHIWNVTFGGSDYDSASSMFIDDDAIYLSGTTGDWGVKGRDVLILKLDTDGNLFWNQTWKGRGNSLASTVFIYNEFLYLTGDDSVRLNHDVDTDTPLLKYDKDGNLVWNMSWGGKGPDQGRNLHVDSSGIYISGETSSFNLTYPNTFLVKFDSEGNVLWDRIWRPKDFGYANSVIVNAEDIYMTGWKGEGNKGWYAFLLKYDGLTTPINYPPESTFSVSQSTGDNSTIFLFNASGTNDPSEPDENLLLRWDWENDGIWDTEYLKNWTAKHNYSQPGNYTVLLEVIDTVGLTSSFSLDVVVTESTITPPITDNNITNNEKEEEPEYIFPLSVTIIIIIVLLFILLIWRRRRLKGKYSMSFDEKLSLSSQEQNHDSSKKDDSD